MRLSVCLSVLTCYTLKADGLAALVQKLHWLGAYSVEGY